MITQEAVIVYKQTRFCTEIGHFAIPRRVGWRRGYVGIDSVHI